MSNPMPLPMRVLVKGQSTVVWTSMMGGPRSDMVFARVMEQELLAKGRSVEVRNTGEPALPTRAYFKTWNEDIAAWSPDIVILHVGHYEAVHPILPRWLERGANTVSRRSGRLRFLFYRRFVRGVARGVIIVQRAIDRPSIRLKRRMHRVVADTAAYIKQTQQVGNPLILLLEVNSPSGKTRDWFPGLTTRLQTLNADLRSLAGASGLKDVRFVEVTDLMDKFTPSDPEHLWADGSHYSPAFHRAVGEKFAAIADEWARSQSHLAQP